MKILAASSNQMYTYSDKKISFDVYKVESKLKIMQPNAFLFLPE